MSFSKDDYVRSAIVKARNILIVTHERPDGDAYGSSLGLKNFLEYNFKGKNIEVFIHSKEEKGRFVFMPGYDEIVYSNSERYKDIIRKEYDIIFCLDLGHIRRIKDERITEIVLNNLDKTIYLDHHDTSERIFCMYYMNYKNVSSTSELIAGYFINNVFKGYEINREAAICFYAGIVSDTGKFSYNKTTRFTHIISSKLLEKGVPKNLVNYYLFYRKTKQDSEFKCYMIKNKIRKHKKLPIVFLFYDYESKMRFNPSRFHVKEVMGELYGMDGALFVFCLDEDMNEDKVYIYMTTITDYDMSSIAKIFNGGGHKGASSGWFAGSIKEAYKNILLVLKMKEKEIKEAVRQFFEM